MTKEIGVEKLEVDTITQKIQALSSELEDKKLALQEKEQKIIQYHKVIQESEGALKKIIEMAMKLEKAIDSQVGDIQAKGDEFK